MEKPGNMSRQVDTCVPSTGVDVKLPAPAPEIRPHARRSGTELKRGEGSNPEAAVPNRERRRRVAHEPCACGGNHRPVRHSTIRDRRYQENGNGRREVRKLGLVDGLLLGLAMRMAQRRLVHDLFAIHRCVMIMRDGRSNKRLGTLHHLIVRASVGRDSELAKKHTHHRKQRCNNA